MNCRAAGRIAVLVLLVFGVPIEAQAQQPQAPNSRPQAKQPISPGGVRITVRNPLQGNWICQGNACTCKQLACAAPSRVSYTSAPTPARNPNQQALEKFAKVDMPKRIMAANAAQSILSDGKVRIEMLSSKVVKHLGYSSVLCETKIISDKVTGYITSAAIFIGPVLVTVQSVSTDRGVAMQSLNDYIRVMSVEEGPRLPNAPAPPVQQPDQEKAISTLPRA